jgi:methyl-accepting chemotaxis protein
MTIFKQLSVLVGIIAISFVGVVGVSIVKLNEVYKTTNYSNTHSIPQILLLNKVIDTISNLRARAFKYQVVTTDASRKKLDQLFIGDQASLKKSFAEYEKVVSTPKGRELLANDEKMTNDYLSLLKRISALSEAGKHAAAKALLMKEHRLVVHKLIAVVNKHAEYNAWLAGQHTKKANKKRNDAYFFLTTLSVVVIIFILVLSAFIIRNILNAIHTIREKIVFFVKEKDLNAQIEYTSNNEFKEITTNFNSLIQTLKAIIVDAKQSSTENASVSHELSTTSLAIGKNAEESSNIVSNTIKEVDSIKLFAQDTATVSETAKMQIVDVSQKLQRSKDEIGSLQRNISLASEAELDLAEKLKNLSSNTEQVKDVLTVISDIADQTNLLALNAAIEAARAGEHGRGFAVVADEVRKLAERTQKSLLEINSTINVIIQSIVEAAQQMAENSQNVQELANISNKVESTIIETNSVMHESMSSVETNMENSVKIAKDTDHIMDLVSNIDTITTQNARSVEEIASAAEHLYQLTEGLQSKLEQFRS